MTKKSLVTKILIVLIPLVTVSQVIVFSYQGWKFYEQGISRQIKNLQELVQVQSIAFAQPIWEYDEEKMTTLMDRIMLLPTVDSIAIFSANGNMINSRGDLKIEPEIPEFRTRRNIQRVAQDETSLLGILQITVNDHEIINGLKEFLWFNALIFMTLMIVLVFSVVVTIRLLISSPLQLLLNSIHEAKSGKQRSNVFTSHCGAGGAR
ncbi:MAG: hypothetical protein HOE30_01755 [Deltaproteobacteria bacterium]|jgi:hypothetical protein|nr:hypothetical protein [Deltaproteobacteria bacterium]MBT4087195.1 hypothetical protein [Deltaproteobacteria bacterium]MBT4290496.1 hypothetical protein [Deltaproteobacteria bacterium]MBT4641360.1 hypothetical protein [Deltaproteobacteria bacterium]MBT7713563.1 hypothetical protein [Deltaproteobacteria bacterium]